MHYLATPRDLGTWGSRLRLTIQIPNGREDSLDCEASRNWRGDVLRLADNGWVMSLSPGVALRVAGLFFAVDGYTGRL